jgi:hypothetical protein
MAKWQVSMGHLAHIVSGGLPIKDTTVRFGYMAEERQIADQWMKSFLLAKPSSFSRAERTAADLAKPASIFHPQNGVAHAYWMGVTQ